MGSAGFLTSRQEQQVTEAIRHAENRTSGEIRVHIEDSVSGDPLERAAYIFHELGMDETKQKNGVLIYIASDDHRAAIYGGEGIHRETGESFWSDILNDIIAHFKKQQYGAGLEQAVRRVGEKLAGLFPPDPDDINELPDDISYQDNRQNQ